MDRIADLAISNALGADVSFASPMGIVCAVRDLLDPLRQLLLGMSLMREKTPQVCVREMHFL